MLALALLSCVLGVLGGTGGPGVAWAEARSYAIDPHTSVVQVVLSKGGVLALLAHDHVLVADGFAGRVTVDLEALDRAALQISLPVASLIVDPPEARAELGLEGKLDDEDRAEIREAMLAADQLDGANFPRIVATLEGVSGTLPELVLSLRVRVRAAERVLSVPVHVEAGADELRANGEFAFAQSAFGIEPFRTLLGAISVADEARVRFRIVAKVQAP